MGGGASNQKQRNAVFHNVHSEDSSELPFPERAERLLRTLQDVYTQSIQPREERFQYELFGHFEDQFLTAKPMILFIGPYSAGKTSFINSLVGADKLFTGPEPTTNKFTVVLEGDNDRQIAGRILVNMSDLPFKDLADFGPEFVDTLTGQQVPDCPLLKLVTLVDTPGILESGRRQYDYQKVLGWFLDRTDLVLVMFDPTKLDPGGEMKAVFEALHTHEPKVRILLNKADTVDEQTLLRVYGAIFWNLSTLMKCSEPPRVFMSSFWSQPFCDGTNHSLFEKEKADVLRDITEVIPSQSLDARVATLLQRGRDVYAHICISVTLRERLPRFFGKDKAKEQVIQKIQTVYTEVEKRYGIPKAQLPPAERYRPLLERMDLYSIPKLDEKVEQDIKELEELVTTLIPTLLEPVKKKKKEPEPEPEAPTDVP